MTTTYTLDNKPITLLGLFSTQIEAEDRIEILHRQDIFAILTMAGSITGIPSYNRADIAVYSPREEKKI